MAAKRSLVPRTLRGRLITGLVALLALACATVGIVTYLAVARALSDGLDNDLQTATGLAYNCWEHQNNDGQEGAGPQQTGQGGADDVQNGGSGLSAGARSDTKTASQHPGSTPAPSPSGTPAATAPAAASPAPSRSPSPLPTGLGNCTGLNEHTFVAVVYGNKWAC